MFGLPAFSNKAFMLEHFGYMCKEPVMSTFSPVGSWSSNGLRMHVFVYPDIVRKELIIYITDIYIYVDMPT